MSKQLKVIISIILLLLLAGAVYFFVYQGKRIGSSDDVRVSESQTDRLRSEYPEYNTFVDDIVEWQTILDDPESEHEAATKYLGLGLAWKSLADRTLADEHYAQALTIYQEGIDETLGRNTVLIANAANMAKQLEDYALAESYFEQALEVAPGDQSLYIALAELYEYRLEKSAEEIIALLDKGINTAIPSGSIERYKQSFLVRNDIDLEE